MTIEDVNKVAEALVNHLKANGVGGTDGVVGFYPNDTVPTSNLPESFVEVVGNGALSTPVSGFGIRSCSLLLILNVKLPVTEPPIPSASLTCSIEFPML